MGELAVVAIEVIKLAAAAAEAANVGDMTQARNLLAEASLRVTAAEAAWDAAAQPGDDQD